MQNLKRTDFLTEKFSALNVMNIILLHSSIVVFFISMEFTEVSSIVYFPLGWIICSLHQRQLSEWFHEGIHFNIHKNKKINEFMSKYFLGCFLGIPLQNIRKSHFNHHAQKDYFGPDDEDTAYAKFSNVRHLLFSILLDLLGFNAIRNYLVTFFSGKKNQNVESKGISFLNTFLPIILFQMVLIILFVIIGKLYLYILYYFSLITLYPVLSRIRVYGQHLQFNNDGSTAFEGSTVSRTIKGSLLERILFSSKLMLFHYEHHKTPHLPYRALEKQCEETGDSNKFLTSYTPVFRGLLKVK